MKLYNSKQYLIEQLKTRSYLQIAKENKISKTTIQRKLHQFGLTKPRVPWTKKEIAALKYNYETGNIHSILQNRTRSSIYHKAYKVGLKRPVRKRYKKVNEKFFKKFTKDSCYVLGWMYSDGNVSKNERTFSMHLNKKDIEIVKKIKKLLNSGHNISVRSGYVEFKIHSKRMCKDLISLGCMPKKSQKIRFPKNLPKKYIRHFIRGYFDGDGSIFINFPNTIKITIVGNRKFINNLGKIVSEILKIKIPKITYSKCVWRIQFYGNNARRFCKWIYKKSDGLYLERKFKIFKEHIKKRLVKKYDKI